MRGSIVVIGTALLLVSVCRAQSGSPTASKFEVASMRLSDPKGSGWTSISGGVGSGRVAYVNAPLLMLIEIAYGVDEYQIEGQPGWAGSALYDVSAKGEGDAPLTNDQLKSSMQQLLEERLHLKAHHETKPQKGYALVVAKGGPKLKAGDGPTGGLYMLTDGLRGQSISMELFAHMLTRSVGRAVVDKTGVPGMYDVALNFAPNGATDSQLPFLFTALEEQMGLKLESAMVPVDMLVIDHVEKTPPEN